MHNHITGFLLEEHTLLFQGNFLEKLEGSVMGSPVNPIVANLYMENFNIKIINTAEHQPRLWIRYINDSFLVLKILDRAHKFYTPMYTIEETREDGSMSFLNTLVMPEPNRSLSLIGYRKPTHTD